MTETQAERHPVFALSDSFVDAYAERSPMVATYLGVAGHDDRWDDTSPAGRENLAAFLREQLDQLAALPPAKDPWAELGVRVFSEFINLELEPLAHGDHLRDLGHLQSLFPSLRDTFDVMDMSSAGGWRNIATRLNTLGEPLAGWRDCLVEGMASDLWAPRRQVLSIISQMRASVAAEGAFTGLLDGFADAELGPPESADSLAALEDSLREGLAAATEAVLAGADWLEQEYLPGAPEADGVGAERYQRHARAFLGTTLDLQDTYRWGWDHLGEIRSEMESLAARMSPGKDLVAVIEDLEGDGGAVATSAEEFRQLMLDREREAMANLEGTHFEIPDEIREIDVKLAPLGNALGAYFMPPSEDFTRPGTTWWSLGEQTRVPLWSQVTIAYHEGFPGHHLQCGLQATLGDRLTRVHRLLFWLPGYGEGWALYAESLIRELGYFDRPEYVMGLLASNAIRAVRVVIDIGCHLGLPIPDDVPFHPGEEWTFDLAVEALKHYSFETDDICVSEITRYLGWPGQAISYKVGERAILDLREQARESLGDRFDLKAFHESVLGSGPVGLDHLRQIVLDPA